MRSAGALLARALGHTARLCLIAAVIGLCLALASNRAAEAQADVEIGSVDCSSDPEVVELRNAGNEAQDMTGWTLVSDPTDSETFDLTVLESLVPGSSVFIESGPGADALFTWSTEEIFRDGDGTDFARLFDETGTLLSDEACEVAQATPTPAASPTPAVQPAAASPAPAGGVPDGGGIPTLADENTVAPLTAMVTGAMLTGLGSLFFTMVWLGSSLSPWKRVNATVYDIPPPPLPQVGRRRSQRPQGPSQALPIALIVTLCVAIVVALLLPLTGRNK
jgi:hypothetical protein